MNFFDAQDQARRASKRLVYVYLLATFLIVAGVTAVMGLALYIGADPSYYQASAGGFARENAGILIAPVPLCRVSGSTCPS